MDLSGNKELLDRYLVAFFASRTAPLRLLTSPSGGRTKLLTLIRLLLAAFTLQSSEPYAIYYSLMAVLLWLPWGVPYTEKSQHTCRLLMIAIGCCSYHSETTHAPHSPTLKPVIGSPPTSPRRLSLHRSTTQANSRHCIIALPIARHLVPS